MFLIIFIHILFTLINANEIDLSNFDSRAFGLPSERVGNLVESWDQTAGYNPEELGEYGEGDILFPKLTKNGLKAESSRWPDAIIPYKIIGAFNKNELSVINSAFAQYHKYTCLKFVKHTTEKHYLKLTNMRSGCWSSVGRIGGPQQLNLQTPSCTTQIGTVLHELMHAAGFVHEQNRPERDAYVDIVWQNIRKGTEKNFQKSKTNQIHNFGIPYDYGSVMHYSDKAFSVNQQPTIRTKKPGKLIGQRKGFSPSDIQIINLMYNCTNI